VPVISRFLGISILMYWNDHAPPHFHAKYKEYQVIINIESGIIKGEFPPRALRLVLEWYDLHKNELMENWLKCSKNEILSPIIPLE
jgi:hypothetical protein